MINESKNFQQINEAFPHIGARLTPLWGLAEFKVAIEDLEKDNRNGQRKGFPIGILFALQDLDSEHDLAFPEHARKSTIWGFTN